MKILSGRFKGKKIEINKSIRFRPTLSRVREDLFNILFHNQKLKINFEDSIFADVNCGSGSIGLEALSRGFKYCYFNDVDSNQIHIINKFLQNYDDLNFKLYNEDLINEKNNIKWELFDVIYFDPPYESDLEKMILQNIKNTKDEAIIITESSKDILLNVNRIFTKKYKNKNIEFFNSNEIKRTLNV